MKIPAEKILKKALIKHGDGSYHYWGSKYNLEICRNWQPIAGMPHKYHYWVREVGTDKAVTSGHDNTIDSICWATSFVLGRTEPHYTQPQPNDGPARLAMMLPRVGNRKIN